MSTIMEIAQRAALDAGKYISEAAGDISRLNIEQKSLHDYVSEVDRNAEKIVTNLIYSAFPDHQIFGEEFGEQGTASADWQWVIDPLDGTTNFLRSVPHYAVSIGVMLKGEVHHGVIYDPAKNDLFYASKGQGSFLNGNAIKVSQRPGIRGALLATGVPYSGENLANIDSFTHTMTGLLELQTSGIRRLGAAALDLAYVAAGRFDGFWEANLNIWDIAAGALLVSEAGGTISDLQGKNDHLVNGDILAAAPGVHRDMLKVTGTHYSATAAAASAS